MKPVLHIIICSTRPSRVGPAIAQWTQQAALSNDQFDAQVVDLASFNLPVFDEPEHPRLQKYQHAHTKAWSASVQAAEQKTVLAVQKLGITGGEIQRRGGPGRSGIGSVQ